MISSPAIRSGFFVLDNLFLDMNQLLSTLVVCTMKDTYNMKLLTKIAAILMMASALMGCNKEPVNNGPKPDQPGVEVEYTDDIEFAIEILSIEATAAEVKVEHTGTKDDTW